jgi:hypothetical protein
MIAPKKCTLLSWHPRSVAGSNPATPTNHSRELCAVAQQADWLRDRLGGRNGIPETTRFLKLRLSAEPDGLALRGS